MTTLLGTRLVGTAEFRASVTRGGGCIGVAQR